ncbi:hypothetical protein M422DRAFT_260990 [Sphaerobolus stellatus SS14]|uniref:Uncharacterized protein n=1 Tax=Sphaerobolus stellatus (strain SS14) TaxID=990650 RepID=A0A0C9UPC0_SPHS4|nr:hypothetical protein M422DRAFT_260990 [Sphaerobolus stellatus SS14]
MADVQTISYAGYIPSRAYRSPIAQSSSALYHLPSPTRTRFPQSTSSSFLPYDPFSSNTPSTTHPSSSTISLPRQEGSTSSTSYPKYETAGSSSSKLSSALYEESEEYQEQKGN